MEINCSLIRGKWLKHSLDVIGVNVAQAAKALDVKPDKFYRHIHDKNHLSSESLAQLALVLPLLNLHYILTGKGRPLLRPVQALRPASRLSVRFKPDLLLATKNRAAELNLSVPAYVRSLIEQDLGA